MHTSGAINTYTTNTSSSNGSSDYAYTNHTTYITATNANTKHNTVGSSDTATKTNNTKPTGG